jgi:hypothetical protein
MDGRPNLVLAAANMTGRHCIMCAKAANSRGGGSPPFGKDSPSFLPSGSKFSPWKSKPFQALICPF